MSYSTVFRKQKGTPDLHFDINLNSRPDTVNDQLRHLGLNQATRLNKFLVLEEKFMAPIRTKGKGFLRQFFRDKFSKTYA